MPVKMGDVRADQHVTLSSELGTAATATVGSSVGQIPIIPVPMSQLSSPVKTTIDAITANNPDSAAYHPASDFSTPAALAAHTTRADNPHNVTASQVGLGNVNNTSDANKPVSTATQTALNAKANASSLATVATTGSYTDLANKPSIPAAQVNADWSATSGVAQVLNKPALATVATTGSYNDLLSKPTIPAAQVNSDWNATSGVAQISNKPTLAPVATSGNYNDLSGKPTIPAVQVSSDWSAVSGVTQILNKPTIPAAQVNADWNASAGVARVLNKPALGSASLLNAASIVEVESDPVASAALIAHAALMNVHGRSMSALTAPVSIANVEKSVVALTLAANSLRVGSTFKFRGHANFTMALNLISTSTAAVRIGPTSLLGTKPATVTVNNGKGKADAPFMVEGEVTVKSLGVVGTIVGWLALWGAAAAPFVDDISTLPVAVTVNTTIQNVIELTYVTTNVAAASVFDVAFVEGG